MPYEKLKNENYQNFGGINTKTSEYITNQTEFLDIRNMDFNNPGSLSQRPGFTQAISAGVSGRITGIYEYTKSTGGSQVIVGAGAELYYKAGTSLVPLIALKDNAVLSFETFVDHLFVANGQEFIKYQGQGASTAALFSMPDPFTLAGLTTGGASLFGNVALLAQSTIFAGTTGLILGGTYSYSYGFITSTGFRAPTFDPTNVGSNAGAVIGFSGVVNAIGLYTGTTTITGSTIRFINIQNSRLYGVGYTAINNGREVSPLFVGAAVYRNSGGGETDTDRFLVGYVDIDSVSGITLISNLGDLPELGAFIDRGNPFDPVIPEPTSLFFTYAPRWLELFNNELFMAGFSMFPSTVWFSEIGEPETIESNFNFEVRTNDGDIVTGLRTYQNQLYIFKQHSFHALSGNNIDNFTLRQISDQYGAISGRAIIVYETIMLFLDNKGIAEFNGANVSIISNKVEPIFRRMNIAAARDNACMIHNRLRNQVWIGIPIDGATENNTTIVYDYLVQAWTVFEGFHPSSLAMMQTSFETPTAFFGSYSSGSIFNFGDSLMNDNGVGFTTAFKIRFIHELGDSVTEQYRRLFFNKKAIPGSTSVVNLNFFQDYGASTVYSTTIGLTDFQTRIDFGIPGKALSLEGFHFSDVDQFVMHGFVLSSRFQRNV